MPTITVNSSPATPPFKDNSRRSSGGGRRLSGFRVVDDAENLLENDDEQERVRVQELIETPVALVSTSPERDDTILMRDPFMD